MNEKISSPFCFLVTCVGPDHTSVRRNTPHTPLFSSNVSCEVRAASMQFPVHDENKAWCTTILFEISAIVGTFSILTRRTLGPRWGMSDYICPVGKIPLGTPSDHRTFGNVFLLDGTHVNHTLVKDGWCWWYRKYAPNNSSNSTYVVPRLRWIQTVSHLIVLCVLPAHL